MNPFLEATVAQPCAHRSAWQAQHPRGIAAHRRSWGRALSVLAGVALPSLAAAVDVNLATAEQLRSVRGIGPKTAEVIVEERTRGGRYESFEDLSDRVKGIGPKKAASLKASGLKLGAGSKPVAPSATTPAITAKGK